ncbi:MAG: DHHA1 domain-containing protein [Acidobacteria bacterium]|nr:DHHA1 domain-containing protein [Acidobacteriota bacterium]
MAPSETDRLYYTDCYLREFDARVVEVKAESRGFRVYLDRSAFYPESGGQPADTGTLDGLPVLEVADEGKAVAHVLAKKPENDPVKGKIDWARRFDHMQQHTGQHVLSSAFEKTGGYKTVSFHLGKESSTIDLNSDRIGSRQIEEAVDSANRILFENREVRIFFAPTDAASRMELRKPTSREGDVRLVEIDGFDLSACGGTHVSRTGAVGIITVRKSERIKGLARVEFVCGGRALGKARDDYRFLSGAALQLSTSLENVPSLIQKQSAELRNAQQAKEKLQERVAEYRALELLASATERKGRRIVRAIVSPCDLEDPKLLAHAVVRQGSATALIGLKGEPAGLIFAQSAGGPDDMNAVLRQTVAQVGGKGGGSRDFAQAGGLDNGNLDKALTIAASLLS